MPSVTPGLVASLQREYAAFGILVASFVPGTELARNPAAALIARCRKAAEAGKAGVTHTASGTADDDRGDLPSDVFASPPPAPQLQIIPGVPTPLSEIGKSVNPRRYEKTYLELLHDMERSPRIDGDQFRGILAELDPPWLHASAAVAAERSADTRDPVTGCPPGCTCELHWTPR